MSSWSGDHAQPTAEPADALAAPGTGPRVDPGCESLIGETTEVSGTVISKTGVRFDGRLDGNIVCPDLMVGKGGEIHGKVISDRVRIHGTLDGVVRAETLSLSESAHVTGELLHRNLVIEPGAFVEGTTRQLGGGGESTDRGRASPGISRARPEARATRPTNRLGLGVPKAG